MIYVLSKKYFEHQLIELGVNEDNVESFDEFAFISIVNTSYNPMGFDDDYYRTSVFKKNHSNVLILSFDDVGDGQSNAFSNEMGEEVVKFAKKHCGKLFFIHCAAGISRSGAIGTFINEYCGHDYINFLRDNPQIVPNQMVLRLLNQIIWNKKFK